MNAASGYLVFLHIFNIALQIFQMLLLVWVIASWLLFFLHKSSFRFRHHRIYAVIGTIYSLLARLFEPLLAPFRKLLPPWKSGGLDLSPLLLIVALMLLEVIFNRWIAGLFLS